MRSPRQLALGLGLGLALALALGACSRCAPRTEAREGSLAYAERITANGDGAAKLPLVLALHGLGDSPESFLELFDDFAVPARIIAPRAPDPWSVGTSWYPIDDEKRAPSVIRERARLLARTLERLRDERPTQGLPVVTGFSQGGVLSFALAAYHPEQIAAALPIAGMLPASLSGFAALSTPLSVVALHGRDDQRIPFARGKETAERLRAAGRDVTFVAFPGVGHNISSAMRERFFAALRDAIERAQGD